MADMRGYIRLPDTIDWATDTVTIDFAHNTPPLLQRQLEDDLDTLDGLDAAFALPELVRFRRIERQAATDVVLEMDPDEDESILNYRRRRSVAESSSNDSRRSSSQSISERLAHFSRKARGSFAKIISRKDSLDKDELPKVTKMRRPAAANRYARLAAQLRLSHPESQPFHEQADITIEDWHPVTMHLLERNADQDSHDISQPQAHKYLVKRLRSLESRGEFRDAVDTTEEEQWVASRDFTQISADRCRQLDEAFKQGRSFIDADDDVDLEHLPFEIGKLC